MAQRQGLLRREHEYWHSGRCGRRIQCYAGYCLSNRRRNQLSNRVFDGLNENIFFAFDGLINTRLGFLIRNIDQLDLDYESLTKFRDVPRDQAVNAECTTEFNQTFRMIASNHFSLSFESNHRRDISTRDDVFIDAKRLNLRGENLGHDIDELWVDGCGHDVQHRDRPTLPGHCRSGCSH